MFTALEKIPVEELQCRYERCRQLLKKMEPEASGMLIASRLEIYYLTGTLANGLLWFPLEGNPVLLTRRGFSRAKIESSVEKIAPYRSYKEIEGLCKEMGSPLGECIAVDKAKFTWQMAEQLQKNLPKTKITSCDLTLRTARSVKTDWELTKIRIAGKRHCIASEEMIPNQLAVGMSELEIAHMVMSVFEAQGDSIVRMYAHGEENYGIISVGESGLYPTYFNGCLGCRGLHPCMPFLGNDKTIWRTSMILTVDFGYALEGYNTDKTQIYWAGPRASIPKNVLEAHDVCEEIYHRCSEALKPGAIPSDIWRLSAQMAKDKGQDGYMGLVGGNNVHFLGHGVGLTVDDLPVFAKGFDDPLEPGMVVALEPKIALPGLGMVGVENTFEITRDGARCLTGNLIDIVPIV